MTAMIVGGDCIHDIRAEWCGICNPRRGEGTPLDQWINQASMVIPSDGEEPLAVDAAADAAGLTRHEFDQAVAAIRERYPDMPLVSDRNGIRFTMDGASVAAFRARGARQALTIIRRRFRGAVLPYLRQVASEDDVRKLVRQADRLLEDIEDFV